MTTVTRPPSPTKPPRTAPEPERYTGQQIGRVEGLAKATGAARYTFDLSRPDMVYGVLLGATIPYGQVEHVEQAVISGMPGVLLVLSAENLESTPGPGAGSEPFAWFDRSIRYDGQPVAFIVAETLALAEDAARALPITYVAEPMAATLQDALAEGAPVLDPRGNVLDPDGGEFKTELFSANYRRGDIASGLAEAEVIVAQRYAIAPEVHTPWETIATLAEWDGERMTVYESTQAPHSVQKLVANGLALPLENVRVIAEYVGGGFGSKIEALLSAPLTALAARQLNRPVKTTLSRAMLFRMAKHRQATDHQLRVGALSDGTLTALDHCCYLAAAIDDDFYDLAAGSARFLYACPNVLSQHRLVRVAFNPATYMRGPSFFQSQFALETAMDELACQLGCDPVELRRRNLGTINSLTGKVYSSTSLLECLTQGAQRIGWERRSADPGANGSGPIRHGLGMAIAYWPTFRGGSRTGIRIDADGAVVVATSSVDIGTGQYTILAQVAADALGANLDDVRVKLGDTTLPRGMMAGGSMGAAATSNATHQAALAAREAMINAALVIPNGPFAGLVADDLVTTHSQVMAREDADRALSFAAVARATGGEIAAEGAYRPAESAFEMADYGAHFAEVAVDVETGMVRVERLVAVHDSGRVLNAHTFRSQLQGGIIWGISAALMEALQIDRPHGRVLNAGLAGYHIPTALDVGELDITWLDEPDLAANPLGVKGVGEVGITGPSPAIGNAIFNATGVRLRSLPFTPRKVLEALSATGA